MATRFFMKFSILDLIKATVSGRELLHADGWNSTNSTVRARLRRDNSSVLKHTYDEGSFRISAGTLGIKTKVFRVFLSPSWQISG
jgi:hypothetical protein